MTNELQRIIIVFALRQLRTKIAHYTTVFRKERNWNELEVEEFQKWIDYLIENPIAVDLEYEKARENIIRASEWLVEKSKEEEDAQIKS